MYSKVANGASWNLVYSKKEREKHQREEREKTKREREVTKKKERAKKKGSKS